MFKFEKKFIEFIEKHYIILSFIIITIIALLIRLTLLNYESNDYEVFISKWFNYMKENGGLKALANFPGNYTAPYMTIIALLTYIPINPLWLIKSVSIIFDFALAVSSVLLVKQLLKKNNNFILLLTYFLILILPTVFLNSSMWGQCDSIYATFVILSLLFLFKGKYDISFIMLGISLSFKLQCIFILPLYIILYVSEKKYSIIDFLLIPTASLFMCLPAICFGMPLSKFITTYIYQTRKL